MFYSKKYVVKINKQAFFLFPNFTQFQIPIFLVELGRLRIRFYLFSFPGRAVAGRFLPLLQQLPSKTKCEKFRKILRKVKTEKSVKIANRTISSVCMRIHTLFKMKHTKKFAIFDGNFYQLIKKKVIKIMGGRKCFEKDLKN